MIITGRAIAGVLVIATVTSAAGCHSMRTVRPAVAPNAPIFGGVHGGDTVGVLLKDGRKARFVVGSIDGETLVSNAGVRYARRHRGTQAPGVQRPQDRLPGRRHRSGYAPRPRSSGGRVGAGRTVLGAAWQARFKREAPLPASLSHPHISAIHGVEDTSDTHALVQELVEGDTLAEWISRGPIPLDKALPIARQICEALEAAHEQAIIQDGTIGER
jgi:serine/threonine protein kinase